MTTPNLVASRPISATRTLVVSQSALLWIAILTPAVLILHGYHPFADDAAIYVSGIYKLVHPALYRSDSAFVLAQAHFSIFPHLMAWMIRLTRLPLEPFLLATHLASIFLFLVACWTLSERVFPHPAQRWCAVAMAAACFTLPVAGTSLALMDPYLTARSFSTPLGLLALTAAIDRRGRRCLFFLLLAALVHPLMAVYAAAFVLLFALVDFGLPRAALLISLHAITAAALVFFFTLRLQAAPAYHEAVLSRHYLIPRLWPAIDDLGLGIPLILFALAVARCRGNALVRKLCYCACIQGIAATLIGFLFARPVGSMLLVRLQPMRSFHILYAVGVVMLGGFLGSLSFGSRHGLRSRWMAVALLCVVAALAYRVQRAAYPLCANVELPGIAPRNPWQQAFLWIRGNTPPDAVFAANPKLIYIPGEDAQGFRVMAERSRLADDKDEGVVVSFPDLAPQWKRQRDPQLGIDRMTDAQRRATLRPMGANWVLLARSASTSLPCPYRNPVAQVCRLD